jgi:hypothetical protein
VAAAPPSPATGGATPGDCANAGGAVRQIAEERTIPASFDDAVIAPRFARV